MSFHGKKVIFGQIQDGEHIDIQSRIDALMGNKNGEADLDKKAEQIQAAKERKAREAKRAEQRQKAAEAKLAAEAIDTTVKVVVDNPKVLRGIKTTAKVAVAAGASWLIYRGVKFIVDKM